MALVQQNNEPVPKNVVPNKIQQIPFAYYPIPPPTPDYYLGEDMETGDNLDSEDRQLPPLVVMLKWCNSDEDSYSSHCPKDKKYSSKRPPIIPLKRKFFSRFQNDSRSIPSWVMLEIQLDLQEEYITFLFMQEVLLL